MSWQKFKCLLGLHKRRKALGKPSKITTRIQAKYAHIYEHDHCEHCLAKLKPLHDTRSSLCEESSLWI